VILHSPLSLGKCDNTVPVVLAAADEKPVKRDRSISHEVRERESHGRNDLATPRLRSETSEAGMYGRVFHSSTDQSHYAQMQLL
jgi:hypothetical protein